MDIDFDDRLDKEYPEPLECEVNGRDCEYRVDNVCHDCGRKMCVACSIGVRHQPRLSKYTYETEQGTERIQQHCPNCTDVHTLSRRNLAIGGGALGLGLSFLFLGNVSTIALSVLGLVVLFAGAVVTWYEYRLKTRLNSNYGVTSMW